MTTSEMGIAAQRCRNLRLLACVLALLGAVAVAGIRAVAPTSIDAAFADFLQALGWAIVHREGRFLPFTMKSRLPKWSWLVDLYLALPVRPLAGQFLIVAEAPEDL